MNGSLEVELRYVVPGWSFSLTVMLINLDKFIELFSTLGSSFLVISLGIFGGLPLGFFVSQFYYGMFKILGGYSRIWVNLRPKVRKPIKLLLDNKVKEEKAFYAYEYILHYLSDSETVSRLRRRWDVIHSFRSLGYSFLIGILIGTFIRIFLFNVSIPFFFLLMLSIFSLGLLLFSYYVTGSVEVEIDEIEYLIFKNFLKNKNLRDLLPQEYFES